ncbi:hypothetical protein BLOT_014222 [Blomia tropicalis]|nr:hypothetical protein BLOT_014222 [Blomia tropicalis]
MQALCMATINARRFFVPNFIRKIIKFVMNDVCTYQSRLMILDSMALRLQLFCNSYSIWSNQF